MPYAMDWIIDKRVMQIVIAGELDSEMIHAMVEDSRRMTDEGNSPIHAITDATRAESIPKYINQIIKEFKDVKPADSGFTIIIANSSVTRFFAQMLLRVLRLEVRFAADMEEAMDILRRVDTTLLNNIPPENLP